MARHCISLLFITLVCNTAGYAEILVPASTAYTSPDPESGKSFDRLPMGRNPGEMKLPPMPKPLAPKPLVTK